MKRELWHETLEDAAQEYVIYDIKRRHALDSRPIQTSKCHYDRAALLEIVDSQAQKIKDLNRVGSNTLLALIEAQEKIAEQADIIGRYENSIANLSAEVLKQAKLIEWLTKERDEARSDAELYRNKFCDEADIYPDGYRFRWERLGGRK